MMRGFLIFVGLLASLFPASAQSIRIPDAPELSIRLDPPVSLENPAYVQQQIKMKITLASKYPYTRLEFDAPEIKSARTITLSRPKTRQVRSYGGDGYVFEMIVALFPESSGELIIPGFSVTGAITGKSGNAEDFHEILDERRIKILPRDPAYPEQWWLVADRVLMTESWSVPPEKLRVGDVVRREAIVTVFGASAESLPVIDHGRSQGIGVADAGTERRTEITPNGVIAHVHQSWNLRIDADDVAYISPLRLSYWHAESGETRRASVPAKRIEPLPLDRAALKTQLLAEARADYSAQRNMTQIVIALLFALIAAFVLWVLSALIPTRADRLLQRRMLAESEPLGIQRAILEWVRSVRPGYVVRTLNDAMNSLGEASRLTLMNLTDRIYSTNNSSSSPVAEEFGAIVQILLKDIRSTRFGGKFSILFKWLEVAIGNRQKLR